MPRFCLLVKQAEKHKRRRLCVCLSRIKWLTSCRSFLRGWIGASISRIAELRDLNLREAKFFQGSPSVTWPERGLKGEHQRSGYVCRGLSGLFSDGGSTPPASTNQFQNSHQTTFPPFFDNSNPLSILCA